MARTQKELPKTLQECYQTDRLTNNLLNWAEALEKWGDLLFKIIIIFGIISTVSTGVTTYQSLSDISEDAAITSTIFGVITNAVTYALYAIIEYCVYHAISLLISALAAIVQNTKISADVALYTAATPEDLKAESASPIYNGTPNKTSYLSRNTQSTTTWKCENCGATNPQSAFYCKDCGKYTDRKSRVQTPPPTNKFSSAVTASRTQSGNWTCKICGSTNVQTDVSCKSCGNYK